MEYTLRTNKLTQPTSYYASPMPIIVGDDVIVEEISLRTDIPPGTITTVILALRNAITRGLENGQGITLENFVRFAPILPGRIDDYSEGATADNLEVSAVISNDIRDSVRQEITLSKLASVVKSPSVAYTTYEHSIAVGLLEVRGGDIDFDKAVLDEGVFYYNTIVASTEIRASDYGSVTATRAILNTPDLVFSPTASETNEWLIKVRTRYTENGTLREGVHNTPVRMPVDYPLVGGAIGTVFRTAYAVNQTGNIVESVVTTGSPGTHTYIFQICFAPEDPGTVDDTKFVRTWIEKNGVVLASATLLAASTPSDFELAFSLLDEGGADTMSAMTVNLADTISLGNGVNTRYGGIIYESMLTTES